ncbi:MAG: hypothetical protein ACKPBA_05530 [Planctomycetota bacterium]
MRTARRNLPGVLPGVLLLGSLAASAVAETVPLRESELPEANFAFAHRLGSGVYDISGRTVQVYSLPFEWRLRERVDPAAGRDAREGRAGLTLTLPVTLGFFDFKLEDVLESGLPSDIATLSFVPGLRWDLEVGDGWALQPFIEAGIARDRSSDLRSRVATVGTAADRYTATGHGMLRIHHAFEYARASIDGLPGDDFALWVSGTELVRPLPTTPGRRAFDWGPYGAVRWYADPPGVPLLASAPARGVTRLQGEIGVSFGSVEPLRIGGVTLPRIGFGWRFGEGLSVARLVIGERF